MPLSGNFLLPVPIMSMFQTKGNPLYKTISRTIRNGVRNMKIELNTHKCAGCGLCRHAVPSLFTIDGQTSVVNPEYSQLLEENEILQHAVAELCSECPCEAVTLIDGEHSTDSATSESTISQSTIERNASIREFPLRKTRAE